MRGLILKISSLTWHNLLFRAADREELSLLRIGNPSQMSWDEMRGWGWHLVFCISTATDRTFHNLVFLEQIHSWSWIIRSLLQHHGSQQVESGWWSVTLDRAEITWSNEADSDYIRSNRDKMLHLTLHCPLCPQPSDIWHHCFHTLHIARDLEPGDISKLKHCMIWCLCSVLSIIDFCSTRSRYHHFTR